MNIWLILAVVLAVAVGWGLLRLLRAEQVGFIACRDVVGRAARVVVKRAGAEEAGIPAIHFAMKVVGATGYRTFNQEEAVRLAELFEAAVERARAT